ncbi:MAG: hypothetical protein KDB52_00520 [Solirubrobacterales bacterium]|nr:hypothetical protein [Solirubrobacterales bacterium]
MNAKAVGALGLGIFAIANALLLVAPLVLSHQAVGFIEPFWTICGFLSLFLGAAAVSLGSLGWLDAKSGVASGGRIEAATGIVLGGLSALIPIGTIAYVVWIFIQMAQTMSNFD